MIEPNFVWIETHIWEDRGTGWIAKITYHLDTEIYYWYFGFNEREQRGVIGGSKQGQCRTFEEALAALKKEFKKWKSITS